MSKLTEAQKVRKVRTIVRRTRAAEDLVKADAPSRSTGIRNVYKASHTALAEIEAVLKS